MAHGLPMPPGVVQPFFLRLQRDDLHVMAFLDGHPAYEAIEAMIRRRDDGRHAVRAIITRHDQSQIDHINDDDLWRRMQGAERERTRCDIAIERAPAGVGRLGRVRFKSFAGEDVELLIVTASPPDPGRGGLSDPGGHSAHSSLPLMWRGASTLAAEGSRVTIDGQRFDLPPKIVGGRQVGLEGYYTEPHTMGAIRAGTETFQLSSAPRPMELGQTWIQAFDDGRRATNAVTHRGPADRIVIERLDPPGERISGVIDEGRLRVTEIEILDDAGGSGRLTVRFDAETFHIGLDGAPDVVAGRWEARSGDAKTLIRLIPGRPNWSVDRAVTVEISQLEDGLQVESRVGRASAP